jgi:predicted phosphodiesterase
MATPSMTIERANFILDAIEQALRDGYGPPGSRIVAGAHGAVKEAVVRLGYSENSAGSIYQRAMRLAGRVPDWSLFVPQEGPAGSSRAVAAQLAQRVAADEVARLKAQVRGLEDALVAAQAWERRAQTAMGITPQPWKPAKPAVARRGKSELWPLLMASDFQTGEVVAAREIDGLNACSTAIFRERYAAMIDKTITLAQQHTGGAALMGCHYVNLGDVISGEIHDDLATTNDLASVPALRQVFEAEVDGIRRLRDAMGRVRVIRVAGNHDRTTHKPRSKSSAEHSYAMLLSWMIASRFEGDARVEIISPASADATFRVAGWNVLATHGDRMGSTGGQGFVGPAATIARGHQKLVQNYASTGVMLDLVLTGHLHTSLKLSHGYANGSIAGYTQYGRDFRFVPAPAQQWLLFLHREHLVSQSFELNLSPRPRRTAPDALAA